MCCNEMASWFQSAPLTEARGDEAQTEIGSYFLGFNPLPSPKQGETSRHIQPGPRRYSFNPLPSPKQGETLGRFALVASNERFNPLPSPKQGETAVIYTLVAATCCFNPLPSPKQGETRPLSPSLRFALKCFNPLPSPKQGETKNPLKLSFSNAVSIRSPHRSKGRLHSGPSSKRYGVFQSAPLTEARGDKTGQAGAISIRLFQSAPLTEARGDASRH